MPANSLIKHVVIIVKENHTFDNYFGTFPGANGDSTLPRATDPPPQDPPHNHQAWLNRAAGAVHAQYKEADIPAYFSYARQFTLCDNYFTEGGYLLDSGSPYRLWFRFDLGFGMKNPIEGNGLDCYRLLHKAEKELATAS